jgi:blue copper oxidase
MHRRSFLLTPPALALSSCATHQPAAQGSHVPLRLGGSLTMRAGIIEPAMGRAAFAVNGIGANPTLVVARGSALQVKLENALPQPTTIHWHGLSPPSLFDGAGFDPVLPGQSFVYRFQVNERAGVYWYHPHPHHFAAEQVYHGMAGMVIVRDQEDLAFEREIGTQIGESDMPIVLQDALYRGDAWQPYAPNQSDCLDGFLGNAMHVNGVRGQAFSVTRGWVRLRLLNASTARGLLIKFRNGAAQLPFHIIGNDGGFLPAAQREEQAFLYPAERLDVLLDCRAMSVGDTIVARSEAFANRHQHEDAKPNINVHRVHEKANAYPRLTAYAWCETERTSSPDDARKDGQAMALFTLRIAGDPVRAGALPSALSAKTFPQISAETITRSFRLDLDAERGWTINGKKFGDTDAAIRVQRGANEIWEIHNAPISMPHPMHLHGFHFRVLKRTGLFGPAKILARHDGLLSSDLGLKDTVTVWPNERVRIAIDFSHTHSGAQRYMFHCHNLEHEDAMMMLPVEVV